MKRNVEIKARLADPEKAKSLLDALGAKECGVLIQHDTFFHCKTGRLKLRVHADGTGQLLYYERPDVVEAKISRYVISDTDRPAELLAVLSAALGITGEVRKTRLLYTIGQTRVHLDRVEGLGDFVEIEVVLNPSQKEEHGKEIAAGMMHSLGIIDKDLVSCAYVNILLDRA